MSESTSETGVDTGAAIHAIALEPPSRRAFLTQSRGERAATFLWSIMRIVLFRWTPRFANGWRVALLRLFGATIGRGVHIAPTVRIDFPWNLRIGSGVTIGHKVIMNAAGSVTVGDRTRISQFAHLCAATHDYEHRDMRILRSPITIGRDVWIAADAFVGPGVTMGDGSLLAARSSAFGELPAGQVCIGEPARPVKPRQGMSE